MVLNNKKIPLIPPLYYDNRFITGLKEKAELFNSCFSKQYSLISNSSALPNYINHTTEKRLSTVALSVESISTIIQNLDSNKTHGPDNISIRILKICGDSIYQTLETIFRQALVTGVFLLNGKKVTLFLSTKKMTSKISKIIVQFLSFRFAVKSLKD